MSQFREHVVSEGDTLQMIAQKVLGDASRGMEIAVLNDLQYPFIGSMGDAPSEGVKLPGETILIPVEVEYNLSVEDIDEELYNRALGVDLFLSTDKFNLSFGSGGELSTNISGDLQTVSGVNTLHQDLIHRLTTEVGTLPYHPTYGSKFLSIIGNRKDSTWKQKAVLEVSRTFKSDSRVVDVTDVIVEFIPTGIVISCTVVTAITKFVLEELVTPINN